MTYFKNVKSLEDLKNQFRELARKNHPDAGGDAETMKAINQEYDKLFPIWKKRFNMASAEPTTETADSTRMSFYTQNGWEGSKHDWNRSLKEVAQIVRAYVKEMYPTYKFSVRTSYASMCQELHVDLKESPIEVYKTAEELTADDMEELRRKAARNGYFTLNSWYESELRAELERIWNEHGNFYRCLNEATKAVIEDVDSFVKSYNYEDCDGSIDYFDVDFYYFGCAQNNGMNIKIVPKTARIKNKPEETAPATTETKEAAEETPAAPEISQEYEIKEDVHTKTQEVIFVVKIVRTLSREEYIKVAERMKSLGGYYSRFKHGFVFKENPAELLTA